VSTIPGLLRVAAVAEVQVSVLADFAPVAKLSANLHLATKIIASPPTNNAFLTRSFRLHYHSIPDLEIRDVLPDGRNNTSTCEELGNTPKPLAPVCFSE